ncbi:MAG TPA: TraR/DksA C4-type zinc finger protein [Jatrophihabitantaceae bacterium]|nr:TraR/DksA C4-type zinc finger protein [Jatrophihabitantaceae bacterium]
MTEQLAAQRADTVARIAALRADVATILGSASSTTGDDEHDPEGATIGFERAQAMALLAQAEDQLAAIDAALDRVAAGTYGRCVSCGQPIAAPRLEARPEATRCITCASR